MADFYRVKIAAKRQVTLPQRMLTQLGLEEGDELEFNVDDGMIRAVRPYRTVPMDYFPPDVLRMIARRSKELERGEDAGYVQIEKDAPEEHGRKPMAMADPLSLAEESSRAASASALKTRAARRARSLETAG